ncbi:MAG: hypothetical protein NVSMB5_11520 [Candidatus Velthaea sp.]
MIAVVIAAFAGASVAWIGTICARALCRDIVPHEDGPAPVEVRSRDFLLAGAVFGAIAGAHAWSPAHLAGAMLVATALATGAACDLRCGMLPDICTLGLVIPVLGFGAARHDWTPAFSAGIIAIPFAGVAALTRGRGMGWGDVKLAAAGAAVLGTGVALAAYVCAASVAYLIARRGGAPQRSIPFGPYLAGSIAVGLAAIP